MTISFFTKQQNLILIQIENADNKINLIEKLKLGLERVENVGKGGNAGYQHFLLCPVFSKDFFLRVVISWNFVVKG